MKFDDGFLADIRDRVPISSLIGSRVSWDRKKTNASRGDWWAPCPFHGEKSPSFHCEDKKQRYHCFGCGASGNHFRFLMDLDGVSFPRAVEMVADLAGMPMPGRDRRAPTEQEKLEAARRAKEREASEARRLEEHEKAKAKRTKSAGAIWKETLPFAGSLAQTYFEWRGLKDPQDGNLRFHPSLEHPDTGRSHPCLVARVQAANGSGTGIWRIFLRPDGRGKLDGVDAKLGFGPTAGGAVRLGGIAKSIGLAEGIETARAVRELGETRPVWAGLSTSGIIGFEIPEGVERVICYPDPDGSKLKTRTKPDGSTFIGRPPGMEAARKLVERYPDRVSIAESAYDADYLEVLQKVKGVPIR